MPKQVGAGLSRYSRLQHWWRISQPKRNSCSLHSLLPEISNGLQMRGVGGVQCNGAGVREHTTSSAASFPTGHQNLAGAVWGRELLIRPHWENFQYIFLFIKIFLLSFKNIFAKTSKKHTACGIDFLNKKVLYIHTLFFSVFTLQWSESCWDKESPIILLTSYIILQGMARSDFLSHLWS